MASLGERHSSRVSPAVRLQVSFLSTDFNVRRGEGGGKGTHWQIVGFVPRHIGGVFQVGGERAEGKHFVFSIRSDTTSSF